MLANTTSRNNHTILESIILADVTFSLVSLLNSSLKTAMIGFLIAFLLLFAFCMICYSGIHPKKKTGRILLTTFLSFTNMLVLFFLSIYFLSPSLLFMKSCDKTIFDQIKDMEVMDPLVIPTKQVISRGGFYIMHRTVLH